MKTLLAGMMVMILIAGCQQEKKKSKPKTPDTPGVEELAMQLMDVIKTGDVVKINALFTGDCQYVDMANKFTYQDLREVHLMIKGIHEWASDIKMGIRNVRALGDYGYVEWTFTARQTKPIPGRVSFPTNKQVSISGVTLLETRDGKISKAIEYMDVLGFMEQLGYVMLPPETPGTQVEIK